MIRGVIEGFYGPPWSWDERAEVMAWCHERGMTHYVYAPKSDPKHRDRWREPYGPSELAGFSRLVGQKTLQVGFAVSPGLTMDYRSAGDRASLSGKIEQVLDCGVGLVCVAFDDIPNRPGLGEQHAEITGWLHDRLGKEVDLLLVPTEYVGSKRTPYLGALADGLPGDVPVAWTGMAVVNDTIRMEEARARAESLKGRAPLLWDNYPVNDGPMADRLHMGPLRGREPGLPGVCSGYLANPMVQARSSKLPLASIAGWLRGADPEAAWLADAGEWRVFAEACDGKVPRDLVETLVETGDGPDWQAPATALAEWLKRAATCEAPGLEGEAGPWLEQVHAEARVALEMLRLLQARTASDPFDFEDAFRLLTDWSALRRSAVSVMGLRFGVRPAMGQRADGGWALGPAMVQEGENAVDRLARYALAVLARLE